MTLLIKSIIRVSMVRQFAPQKSPMLRFVLKSYENNLVIRSLPYLIISLGGD